MSDGYDDAVAALFAVPHHEFVEHRKRLANELKAAGNKAGAAKLAKIARPPISAWAVNQLWREARTEFDALLASAQRLRDGDLSANAAHRESLTTLRQRAAAILTAAEHSANEATLRRVATTLSAIAALGSFAPDPPGALADDRDPPGFEAAGILSASAPEPTAAPASTSTPPAVTPAVATARDAEQRAAARRAEAAEAARKADRERHLAALRTAVGDVERRERELERLLRATSDAEEAVAKARAVVADLEAKLATM